MEIYRYIKQNAKASVGALVSLGKLTQPTVSYHLKEMREAGLLKSEKQGKEVYYSLNEHCPIHQKACVLSGVKL